MTADKTLISNAVKKHLKTSVHSITLLSGGGWANVYKVDLESDRALAAKVCHDGHQHLSHQEAMMLAFLEDKTEIPFPKVMCVEDGVLLLNFIENDGQRGQRGEHQAGQFLASLHEVTADKYGFQHETIFGPIGQPNPWTEDWVEFFRDQRLRYIAEIAYNAGKIDKTIQSRIEALCSNLDRHLNAPAKASLLHGDFWGGNVLYNGGKCVAFIDPALYFGHPEADLAFATLFGSFGKDFFAGYCENREIEDGFFEERLDIYNLWPLLFHAYWFGGHYVSDVDGILKKLGYD